MTGSIRLRFLKDIKLRVKWARKDVACSAPAKEDLEINWLTTCHYLLFVAAKIRFFLRL
jgi:hypothetical protein